MNHLRRHITSTRQCASTGKWIYQFRVNGCIEEAIDADRWKALALAYQRVLYMLAAAGEPIARETFTRRVAIHPAAIGRFNPVQLRSLLRVTGCLAQGCTTSDCFDTEPTPPQAA